MLITSLLSYSFPPSKVILCDSFNKDNPFWKPVDTDKARGSSQPLSPITYLVATEHRLNQSVDNGGMKS